MQTSIGILISIIVVAIAFIHAFSSNIKASLIERIVRFVLTIIAIYVAAMFLLGVVYLILYLGVLFRQGLMWLVEAVFWFMPTIN